VFPQIEANLGNVVSYVYDDYFVAAFRPKSDSSSLDANLMIVFGVPYGSRTRVAAVKEKRPIVIQGNLAAWMALYRT
jgi:hypothetical protein